MPDTAASILRVSTKKQLNDGDGIENQRRGNAEYIRRKGYRLASEFVVAESADGLERTDFEAVIREVIGRRAEIRVLVFWKVDRISRGGVLPYFTLKGVLAKHGIRVEFATAFDPQLASIGRQKWWKVDLDPAKTNHALREVAAVIDGCLAARRAGAANADELLTTATDAGDFLVWAQERAGTGVFPFPAVRNGSGRPFEVAERRFKQAEKDGKLDEVIKNGWAVEDFDDGGLQFDNGLAGVGLVRLFEATKDDRYKKAAVRAADWARTRRVVPNWNYNSFSVLLLAEVHHLTGDEKYLASAKLKTRLGVLPGQLTDGPHQGRWADAHNARPAYHYILVRGLAALAAVMPKDDPDRPAVVESLRLALNARNPDFETGIVNADSAVEALVGVKGLPTHVAEKLAGCKTDEALATLERYAADGFRANKTPLGPAAWGQLLAYRKEQTR